MERVISSEGVSGEQDQLAAAMLRMLLSVKREPSSRLEKVMGEVVDATGVDAGAFQRFLAQHLGQMGRLIH